MNYNEQMIESRHAKNNDQSEYNDNGGSYCSDSNSQENYQLMPRQHELTNTYADDPVNYRSKPFVYTLNQISNKNIVSIQNLEEIQNYHQNIENQTNQRNDLFKEIHVRQTYSQQQIIEVQISRKSKQKQNLPENGKNNIQAQHSQLQIQQNLIKQLQQQQKRKAIEERQRQMQILRQKQMSLIKQRQLQRVRQVQEEKYRQRQRQKSFEQNMSFVSKSSSKVDEESFEGQIEQNRHLSQSDPLVSVDRGKNKEISNKAQKQAIETMDMMKKQSKQSQAHEIGYFNLNTSQRQPQNSHINSFSNNSSYTNQFSTQKISKDHKTTRQVYNSPQYNRSSKGLEEDIIAQSIKLMRISPQNKMNEKKSQVQISFSPGSREDVGSGDKYSKYRKYADESPILDQKSNGNKGSQLSIERETEEINKRSEQQTRQSSGKYQQVSKQKNKQQQQAKQAKKQQQAKLDYLQIHRFSQGSKQNSPSFNSQQQLAKSLQQIDDLRKDLVKSTQNNIHALFTTKLTEQQCNTGKVIGKIQQKVNQLCEKVGSIEKRRVEELERELQNERRKYWIKEMQEINRERQFGENGYGQQYRRENRRDSQNTGNTIIDLGKNSNEGKIIAIIPSNQINSLNTFIPNNHQQNAYSQEQAHYQSIIKSLSQTQQTFLQTLEQFQDSINLSLQKKLVQMQQKIKKSQQLQKLQRVSQQTNDRDEEYDDSRGSISVVYIRKLREFEEIIKEKQYKIERLEKHNFYLEQQIEKIEQLSSRDRKSNSKNSDDQLKHALNVRQNSNNDYRTNRIKQSLSLTYSSQTISNNVHSLSNNHAYAKNPYNTNYFQNQPNNHNDPNQLKGFPQETLYSFSKPNLNINTHPNNSSSLASSLREQQKIKQPTAIEELSYQTNNNLNFSKKKNTQSFHFSENKNIESTSINEIKAKLSQEFELLLKQKDLRIRQLQNTIMDHLESSRRWKQQRQSLNNSKVSSSITGYSSVASKQANTDILHMKITNLKTLLKESKKQTDKYKNLYQQSVSNQNSHSHHHLQIDVKNTEDLSNTSKSFCTSDKTTVKNTRQTIYPTNKTESQSTSPFAQIISKDPSSIHKSRFISQQQQQSPINFLQSMQSQNTLISILSNFILMAWSLKQVISSLCSKQVDIQKINRNARQFITQLRTKQHEITKKLTKRIQLMSTDSMIKQIWLNE